MHSWKGRREGGREGGGGGKGGGSKEVWEGGRMAERKYRREEEEREGM